MLIPSSTPISNSARSQDFAQASAYIGALTGQSVDKAIIDFRCIHDTDKGVPARSYRGTLPELWETLCSYNTAGYGIFCNINELDGLGRELSNVASIRCHVIDLDNPMTAQQNFQLAANAQPAPSFAVYTSPGKAHVYWRVTEYQGNERYTAVQRKLRQVFDGDRAVVDPTRILRVPGFYHLKNPQAPHLVTIEALPGFGTLTTVEALEAALAHVNVIDGGSGERRPLGDPALAAPSSYAAHKALDAHDPNDLSRDRWIAITAQFKQAGWTVTDEPTLRAMWDVWCARYSDNDPAENEKQWNSIRDTSGGWTGLLHGSPARAELLLGPGEQRMLVPNPATVPEYLDGIEAESVSSTTAAAMLKMHDLRIPIAYDEFAGIVMLTAAVPWDKASEYPRPWIDNDVTGCKTLLESCFLKPSKETVNDAAIFIARRNAFHPIRDYLNSLRWDGVSRLPCLLPRYFGTVDDAYTRAIGMRFMIGAVARVMQPGCKLDTMLILEGPQGARKSSALQTLCGKEWFADQLPDITNSKEVGIHLSGKWIIEIAELSAFNRAASNRIKSSVSSSVDRFRAPYGKNAEDHPRQCVFAGSTNDEHYLRDQTGNRRYWPVAVGTIDLRALANDRDQLWAEARSLYDAGEQWWLTDAEAQLATDAQEDRREVDPWEQRVREYVDILNGAATTPNIVAIFLNIPLPDLHTGTFKRIANCLRAAGYERRRHRDATGKQVWKYGPK